MQLDCFKDIDEFKIHIAAQDLHILAIAKAKRDIFGEILLLDSFVSGRKDVNWYEGEVHMH